MGRLAVLPSYQRHESGVFIGLQPCDGFASNLGQTCDSRIRFNFFYWNWSGKTLHPNLNAVAWLFAIGLLGWRCFRPIGIGAKFDGRRRFTDGENAHTTCT